MEIALRIPMEEETIPMLIGGFCMVMSLALIGIIYFWITNRQHRDPLKWITAHFVFFTIAVILFLKELDADISAPMVAESNSLTMGVGGVIWAISMYCLMLGIRKLIG